MNENDEKSGRPSDEQSNEGGQRGGVIDPAALTFEQRVRHFEAGYANSQAVVRFLDQKAAAVIGVVPIVLGALAAFANWSNDTFKWSGAAAALPFWAKFVLLGILLIAGAVLLYFSWRALAAAFAAISPQNIGKSLPSLLFPFGAAGAAAESLRERVQIYVKGGSTDDVVECYRRQMIRMGEIVAQKMQHTQDAVSHLKGLFVSAAAVLLLIYAGAAVGSLARLATAPDGITPPAATAR